MPLSDVDQPAWRTRINDCHQRVCCTIAAAPEERCALARQFTANPGFQNINGNTEEHRQTLGFE
ncbi:hypothetical protein, partial [Mesorhizobium japonicum]|uniref:hypothetical protein n=1 Tax=Mesorhizobium japonicum TaxID=2066070 RepID=UPI003B5B5BD1